MIVFENEFSAIIRQTQTIYDCNRLPSLCSNLLRPFDPLKDYLGWGQWSLLVTTLKMVLQKHPKNLLLLTSFALLKNAATVRLKD